MAHMTPPNQNHYGAHSRGNNTKAHNPPTLRCNYDETCKIYVRNRYDYPGGGRESCRGGKEEGEGEKKRYACEHDMNQ
jgi:hypothetical protein